MNAADRYAAVYDAALQAQRFADHSRPGDHWADWADLFRFDPTQPLPGNLGELAGYLRPDDRMVDVGGGAGRVSLAVAGRVKEVLLVEPSPAMRARFVATRDELGIANARAVDGRWPDADAAGDTLFVADVTYFVRDIVPFVAKLRAAASRRVMITLWHPAPGDFDAELRRIALGETLPPWPGLPELAPVLWDMGLLPEIRPMAASPWWAPRIDGSLPPAEAAEQAIDLAMGRLERDDARTRQAIADNFDRLFTRNEPGELRPRWLWRPREMLLTWTTGREGNGDSDG